MNMKVIGKIAAGIVAGVLVLAVAGFVVYKTNPDGVMAFLVKSMPGNADQYAPDLVEKDGDSSLRGRHILFLGSSITEGAASCGNSFVEYLEASSGVVPMKEAVGGTTLVTVNDTSYIPRLEQVDKNLTFDAVVCQLSTNDASQNMPLGELSSEFDKEQFDTSTVAGAIEYIIAYSSQTWSCPVIFYTNPQYNSETYAEMVGLLLEIQKKWNIGVIDLWNNKEFNEALGDNQKLWMSDSIHPTMAGYRDWWTPEIKDCLEEYFTE